jgi:hypothetical protein
MLLVACGGDDDGGGGNVTTNTASASSAVTQVGSIATAFDSGDGAAAAGAVFSMGASAQSILTPSAETARQLGGVRAATGTCECDASGCTFVDCGDSGWTINGSLGVDGDTYAIDLDLDVNSAGLAWAWSYDGEITVTPTLIDGSLSGEGGGEFTNQQDGSSIELDFTWAVDYNDIELDGSSCAVGGSLDAEVSYSASGSNGSGSYSGSGHVDFGPACGDAT